MSQIWGRNVTLFGSDFDSGVSAGIGVFHTCPKSGGDMVTLFGSDFYVGVCVDCWYKGHTYRSQIWGQKSHTFWQ